MIEAAVRTPSAIAGVVLLRPLGVLDLLTEQLNVSKSRTPEPRHRQGSSDALYRLLLTQILDGTLEPGLHLPTETVLAQRHGVARSTLRRAMDRLRHDKLITSRRGDGNYVAGLASNERRTFTIEPDCSFDQVFEIRRSLDGLAAAHAALSRDSSVLDKLEEAQDVMRVEVDGRTFDAINMRRADIDFHNAIAECSPNALLKELIATLTSAVGPYWLIWMKLDFKQTTDIAKDTLREHELIVAAIKAGDPQIAEAAMRRHFQTSQERTQKLFGSTM